MICFQKVISKRTRILRCPWKKGHCLVTCRQENSRQSQSVEMDFTKTSVWSYYPTTPQPRKTPTKINGTFHFLFSRSVTWTTQMLCKKKKKNGKRRTEQARREGRGRKGKPLIGRALYHVKLEAGPRRVRRINVIWCLLKTTAPIVPHPLTLSHHVYKVSKKKTWLASHSAHRVHPENKLRLSGIGDQGIFKNKPQSPPCFSRAENQLEAQTPNKSFLPRDIKISVQIRDYRHCPRPPTNGWGEVDTHPLLIWCKWCREQTPSGNILEKEEPQDWDCKGRDSGYKRHWRHSSYWFNLGSYYFCQCPGYKVPWVFSGLSLALFFLYAPYALHAILQKMRFSGMHAGH